VFNEELYHEGVWKSGNIGQCTFNLNIKYLSCQLPAPATLLPGGQFSVPFIYETPCNIKPSVQ